MVFTRAFTGRGDEFDDTSLVDDMDVVVLSTGICSSFFLLIIIMVIIIHFYSFFN